MPIISSLGASSSRGFGAFAQSSTAAKYIEDYFSTWLYTGTGADTSVPTGESLVATEAWSTIKYAQGSTAAYGVASDSSSNVYVCGETNDGQACFAVAKFSSTGALVWQRKVKENNFGRGAAVAVDSSGNVYATGVVVSSTPSVQNCVFTVKYNSSGVLQWQRKLTDNSALGYGIAVDASGNVYVTGIAFNDGNNDYCIVAKYDTSGTLQWSRNFQQGISYGSGIAVNSSGDVYVAATILGAYIALVKYNSSGTLQWQRKLEQGSGSASGVALDSSGNPYIVGSLNDGSSYILTAKYNSSGTLQWQRKLNVSGQTDRGFNIAIDSSDGIYVCGQARPTVNQNFSVVAKYNSSGVIQWQRSLFENSTSGNAVTTDTSGNVYLASTANNNTYMAITKLKADGTTTSGNAFLYMFVSTIPESAGTATESASAGTSTSSAATAAVGTATDAAGTATASLASQAATTTSGGLVWIKSRSAATDHALYDTARGATFDLVSNSPAAQTTQTTGLTSFSASGFSLGSLAKVNTNNATYAAWTFVETPKFFDVVTYTGNGVAGRTVSHNLGSVPGMIIVKCYSSATPGGDTAFWNVYHRGINNGVNPASYYMTLNTTNSQIVNTVRWNNTNPTSTNFTLGTSPQVNGSGETYVAYLFAHDAGGFGLDGTQNVISCGSFTTDGSGNATVSLGWEPQYLLVKSSSGTSNWWVVDNMRGFSQNQGFDLKPNTTGAEGTTLNGLVPTSTGFQSNGALGLSTTYIYMAIRRGPMKVPTDATTVFSPSIYTGPVTSSVPNNRMLAATDVWFNSARNASGNTYVLDRLRGWNNLYTPTNAQEDTSYTWSQTNQTTLGPVSPTSWWGSSTSQVDYYFKRAPGFMDEVCYTGTGAAATVTHNLGVVPEMMIVKGRSGATDWPIYHVGTNGGVSPQQYYTRLNSTAAQTNAVANWNNTAPTSTVFSVGGNNVAAGLTYVAYLFATCPGVSKVGSYTGTGATQTISCGFTGGARYVMIKRTDSTGDWWFWDTARGMVAGTDPRLAYNSSAAEINANWVYTTTGGFQIVTTDATVNASGGTYIYLAIA